MSLDLFNVVGYHVVVNLAICDLHMGEKDQYALITNFQSFVFLLFQEYF